MTSKGKSLGLDPETLPARRGSSYPKTFQAVAEGRIKRILGDHFDLTQFGVNLVRLEPGAGSALRHWHSNEDEFVYVLEGEITMITDQGAEILTTGMVAGFPAGKPDGHQLVNKSDAGAVYLEIGTRAADDRCVYPDDDLLAEKRDGTYGFTNRAGEPYE